MQEIETGERVQRTYKHKGKHRVHTRWKYGYFKRKIKKGDDFFGEVLFDGNQNVSRVEMSELKIF